MQGSIPKVLIVEDDDLRYKALSRWWSGVEIIRAKNAPVAILLLSSHHFDVVSLDHDLNDVESEVGVRTGKDIVNYIAEMQTDKPNLVLVHTGDDRAAEGMLNQLVLSDVICRRLANLDYSSVVPIKRWLLGKVSSG
jgi:CheY-like chemotaxis protein